MTVADAVRSEMAAVGELAEYDGMRSEIAEISDQIDALRGMPFADDDEYDRQRSEISFLQLRRRHLKARASRMLDAAAGRVARAEMPCAV